MRRTAADLYLDGLVTGAAIAAGLYQLRVYLDAERSGSVGAALYFGSVAVLVAGLGVVVRGLRGGGV